ncbi:MAG TPA: hypothetical protein PL060_06940, partial [bacterium]|nr:hypothetical protein [bacterium]
HVYSSSIDWSSYEKIKQMYEKMGKQPVPIVSTEFSKVGGMDQVQRSRDMIMAHLDAFAHGMKQIYYFNQFNTSEILKKPFLRKPTNLGGSQTSGFMFIQWVDRPRISEDIITEKGWNARYPATDITGSLMPLLQTMTYYNLVQNFDTAVFRTIANPDDNTIVYIFDREDATVVAIWQKRPLGKQVFLITSDTSYVLQDFWGRKSTIQNGASLITVGQDPIYLIFKRRTENIKIVPAGIGMKEINVVRGSKGEMDIEIPTNLWQNVKEIRLSTTVDGYWPETKDVTVKIDNQRQIRVRIPLQISNDIPVGTYPLTTRIFAGKNLVGILCNDLEVREPLMIDVTAIPLTKKKKPGIKKNKKKF